MIPSNELRFVERIVYVNAASGDLKYEQKRLILQQKWVGEKFDAADYSKVFGKYIEEWRDVPVEKETQP